MITFGAFVRVAAAVVVVDDGSRRAAECDDADEHPANTPASSTAATNAFLAMVQWSHSR
jgi:hypothetical protein